MAPTGPRTAKALISKASTFTGPLNLATISTLTTIASMHGFALSIITAISLTFPADAFLAYLSVCPSEPFKAAPFLMLFLPWFLTYMDATPQAREQLLAGDDWPLADEYKTYLTGTAGTLKSPSRRTAAAAARAASPPPRNNASSAHDSGDDDRDHAAVERARSQLAGGTFITDVKYRFIPLVSVFLLVLGSAATDPIRAVFFTEIAPMVALLAAAMEAPELIAYLDTAALRSFTDAASDFVTGSRRSLLKPLAAGSPPATPLRQVLTAGAQDVFIKNEGQGLMTEVLSLADGAGASNVMLNALHHKLRTTTSSPPADVAPTAAAAAARTSAPAAAVTSPPLAQQPSMMDQLRTTFGVPAIDFLASAEIAGLPLPVDEPPSALPTAGAAGGGDAALLPPFSIGAPLAVTVPGSAAAPPPPPNAAAAVTVVAVPPLLTSSARVLALRPYLPPTESYMKNKVDRVGDNIPSRNQQQLGQEEQFSLTMSAQGAALLTARPRSASNLPISPAEFVAGSYYILYSIYCARIADPKMFEALIACYCAYEQHIVDLYLKFPSLEMYRPIQNYDLAVRTEILKGSFSWDDASFGNLFNIHIATAAVLAFMPRSFAPSRGDFRGSPRLASGPSAVVAAYCRNYNRPASGGCTLANCPRPHVCSSCGGAHPNCSASGSGGQSGGRGGYGGGRGASGTRGPAA